ncbi:unnamed protein product [Kuraishia capsulata CBS 1993]|uniref:Mitochondrial import inner membrane translocase subunit TIM44 n=1 Tax=Kuraishia capsulata CBS 1993 TaxID=1382522 RepID=W6MR69_9ASCO|nr:uncharacterized protein KUCA_T00005204001 [Kuraishia capsulata CBS 1993]CDK29216.1 unnamed protein product [Kuraishia capsulata CBS 1993]
MLRSQILLVPRSLAVQAVSRRALHSSAYSMAGNNGQKSPLEVFYDTFKNEWNKSSELKENVKALQSATDKMADSEAFHKAKEAYEAAQKRRGAASEAVKKTAEVVGDAAVKAWDSPVGKVARTTVRTTAEVVDKAIDPVRKTKVYKDVSEVIDDGSSFYGGYETKDKRHQRREQELSSGKRPKVVKSNEDSGTALVTTNHKSSDSKVKFSFFKPESAVGKVLAVLKEKWDESDNGFIAFLRTVFEKIAGFFDETEAGKVVRAFKEIDPSFNTESFTKELREYIVPEVVDAFIQGDEKTLKNWLSEAPYNIIAAQQKQLRDQGLFSDGKILDIRNVDIAASKILSPNNIPVMVVGCRVQEINIFRSIKTGEIAAGTQENIMLSTYALVLTRIPEDVDNKITDGWKILEFVRGSSREYT